MSASDGTVPAGTAPADRMRRLGFALLLLFVPSGVAGLIYQSIWSQYLGLTLGHAAYAQTLVLAIFMGGMALGAWACSRLDWSARRLLVGYAVVEVAIGVAGLVFHPVFDGFSTLSREHVLPMLSGTGLTGAWQWISAGLLILPQCVLLGATFPLLSTGLLKMGMDGDSRVLGGLYFSNSLGAAAGALFATFLLLPKLGLPGTVQFAGWLNLMIAAVAWLIARSMASDAPLPAPAAAATPADGAKAAGATPAPDDGTVPPEARAMARLLLLVAFATGASSFVYEIGWIRMLNQALGTTIHSFELMLAAFILGLAFGGLWVRRRVGPHSDAMRLFGIAQIAMGACALLSLMVFAQSFRWMGWIQAAVARGDEAYQLYSFATAIVCLAVMFPAAFFAGMTLPLCTMVLLRMRVGMRAVGQVYAANTLGAIVGVFAMVHVLVPLVGVRHGVLVAALVDVALGFWLLHKARMGLAPMATWGFATAAALFVALVGGRVDPHQQVAGVFRTGVVALPEAVEIKTIVDGKTSTVSSIGFTDGYVSIITNGKPDAMLALRPELAHTGDEPTMVMAGVLPLLHHPDPKQVAIIGWGSGLTTHTIAGSPLPDTIESIEIEPAMVEVAKLFGDRVVRAYDDPRSKIVVEDARTHFAAAPQRYDVVVSEPSNPWISGVANLFTEEFYRLVHRHLEDDGVLVQWLHVYEIDEALFGTMLAALIEVFPDTRVYLTNSSDVILVAHKGARAKADPARLRTPALAAELERLGLARTGDFSNRCLGGGRLLRAHVARLGVETHSDYYPTVSLLAPRTRFRSDEAADLLSVAWSGLPVLDVLAGRQPPLPADIALDKRSPLLMSVRRADAIAAALRAQDPVHGTLVDDPIYVREVGVLLSLSRGIVQPSQQVAWTSALANVADGVLGLLRAGPQADLWTNPAWLADPASQPPVVREMLAMYAATGARDWPAAAASSRRLLAWPEAELSAYAREQALLIARLAAVAAGDAAGAKALAAAHAEDVEVSGHLRPVHRILDGWDAVMAMPADRLPPADDCSL